MRKIGLLLIGLTLGFQVLAADVVPGPAAVLGAKLASLQLFLQQDENKDNAKITRYVDAEIAPMFDTAYMTQWIAGPVGRHMSESQKIALEVKVRTKLFNMVLKQLSGYSGQKIIVRGGRQIDIRQAIIHVAVVQPRGQVIPVDFRLYKSKAGWKIFDIVANRVSMLNNFRQQFMANNRWRR